MTFRFRMGALLLLAPFAACRHEDPAATMRRSEKTLLDRQIHGLQELIAAASGGSLAEPRQIFIGIEEQTIQQLMNTTLPQEVAIADRFLVRLSSAEASFRASQATITLRGRARPKNSTDTYVDVRIRGGLDRLDISKETGTLVGHVVADHLEVERVQAGGSDRPNMQALIQGLVRTQLGAISEAIPAIEIPVRLDPDISVGGFGEGPVRVAPGKLPLKLAVARIVPITGRLWVVLDVDVGHWQRLPEVRK